MSMNLQISVSQITDLIKKNELDSAEIEAKKICSKFSDIDIAHNLLGIVTSGGYGGNKIITPLWASISFYRYFF